MLSRILFVSAFAVELANGQPLMPVFEDAASSYQVPVEILLALGKLGSGFINRGAEPTIEDGYGMMALRGGRMGGDSLATAARLTVVDPEQLKRDPSLNILGAAAALNEYARQTGVPAGASLVSWRPVIERYAGLDKGSAQVFVYEVYDLLQRGFSVRCDSGEVIRLGAQAVELDVKSLLPASIKAAAPDYPPGTWAPAVSCNYSTATNNKDTLVIHTIEGTAAGAISWFQNCASVVSAHYVVSESGLVWQMVREDQTAWHAGCYNSRAIGIEHEGYAASASHPTALYNASALLARDICDQWGIPREKRTVGPGIIGHVDVTHCCCGTHTDPGNGWDWTYYIGQINGTPLAAAYNAQSYQQTMIAGSTAIVWAEWRNSGSESWKQGEVRLGTWAPQDRASVFYTPGNWPQPDRPTEMDAGTCPPGSVCRFTFIMTAPQEPGVYRENWRLVKEFAAWFGDVVWFEVNVVKPQIPADMDHDGDVDQADFGLFQACYSGPAVPQAAAECAGALLDSDNDVDLDDFAKFTACVSGPNVPGNAACTP